MTARDFDRLRNTVLYDTELQARLRDLRDDEAFVAELLRLARERELHVTGEDVANALNAAHRTWLERWL